MTTPSTQGTCLHVICGGIYWHVLSRATNSLVVSCHVVTCQPNKNVSFFNNRPIYHSIHWKPQCIHSFTMTIPTNMTRRKRNRIATLHAQASFRSNTSSKRSFWVEDAPYRAAHYWRLESKDECMLPNHQVRHMEGCQSLLLVTEHAGRNAHCCCDTCLQNLSENDAWISFCSFDFGCTTIWYVLYVLSLSWRVHACLHRDSAKWLTSFPFLWLTNIPTVAWPKSTTGRLMLL
jgi:hypothetical protein